MMRRAVASSLVVVLTVPLLPALTPAAASAQLQRGSSRYQVGLTGSVRLQGFSRLGTVRGILAADRPDPGPAGPGERSIAAEVRAQSGLHLGAAAEWRATGALVVRLSGGRQSTTMEVAASSTRTDDTDPRFFELEDLGRLEIWTGSLGAQWRFGGRRAVVRPYVGAGVGVSHWSIQDLTHIPEIEEIVGDSVGIDPVSATLPAAELQAGVELPLSRRFRIRLHVSDHMSRNPLEDDDFRLGRNFQASGRADDWVHAVRGGVGVWMKVF